MSKIIKLANNTYLDGTIIDIVTNAYGTATKFSNGFMICNMKVPFSANGSWTQDSIAYRKELKDIAFPTDFVDKPSVNATFTSSGTIRTCFVSLLGTTASKIGTAYILTYWNATDVDGYIDIIAIGRWK